METIQCCTKPPDLPRPNVPVKHSLRSSRPSPYTNLVPDIWNWQYLFVLIAGNFFLAFMTHFGKATVMTSFDRFMKVMINFTVNEFFIREVPNHDCACRQQIEKFWISFIKLCTCKWFNSSSFIWRIKLILENIEIELSTHPMALQASLQVHYQLTLRCTYNQNFWAMKSHELIWINLIIGQLNHPL